MQIIDVPGHGEVEFPDNMNDDQIAAAIKKNLLVPNKPSASGSADAIGSVVNTISEPVVSMATGTAGAVAGGLAGIAGAALPGPQGQGRDWAAKVQNALTYEPRSAGGKALLHAVNKPFEYVAQFGNYLGQGTLDKTGSPLAATAVDTAVNALPMFAGGLLGRTKLAAGESPEALAARQKQQSINSVKDQTLAEGRAEGYVVPPSAVDGGSFVKNRLEGIAGKAALKQEASLKNQEVTSKIARREAGLAEDAPITEKTLSDARDVISQPYRDVAALSPRAEVALEKMKETRAEAKTYWNHYNRSADPKSLNQAKALDNKAEMYESVIEKEASRLGKPDLVDELREARVALAKNYTVERALNVGTGDIDAHVIGSLLDKKGLKSMTGGLQTVGKFAEAFPAFTREAAKVPAPGVSKLEGAASVMMGLGAHAALGPPGWLAAGIPYMSHPTRSLMLSKAMQQPRTYDRSTLSFAREEAAKKAGLLGLMGVANGQ